MDDETIICTCMNVTIKDIKDAILQGDESFADMQNRTGLGTICGVCIDEGEEIFTQLKDQVKK